MNHLLRSGVVLSLLMCASVYAEAPAGVVPYFQSGGEVYLLLAEHAGSGRGWAGFGGGDMEGENYAQTAARKGMEESRGYYKSADLLRRMQKVKPVMDGHFASYFVPVDFVPAPVLTNHPVPEENDAYLERSTFAWIPYSAVVPHLGADIDRKTKYMIDPAFLPKGSETQWFWPIWLSNMRKAEADGTLPWSKR